MVDLPKLKWYDEKTKSWRNITKSEYIKITKLAKKLLGNKKGGKLKKGGKV